MMIITCNIRLEIGKVYPAVDKDTKQPGKFRVMRESTREEYLKQPYDEVMPLEYFYEVSFD